VQLLPTDLKQFGETFEGLVYYDLLLEKETVALEEFPLGLSLSRSNILLDELEHSDESGEFACVLDHVLDRVGLDEF